MAIFKGQMSADRYGGGGGMGGLTEELQLYRTSVQNSWGETHLSVLVAISKIDV